MLSSITDADKQNIIELLLLSGVSSFDTDDDIASLSSLNAYAQDAWLRKPGTERWQMQKIST